MKEFWFSADGVTARMESQWRLGRASVLLLVLAAACDPVGGPHALSPAAPDAGACADHDRDGFGEGCAKGRDCDDADPDVTNQCVNCIAPEQGCACDNGASPQSCFLTADALSDGRLMCHEGTRYCRDSTWSACESVHSYVMAPRAATRLVPDAGHPNCTPCDVLCYRIDDNLDPVDGGLTDANSVSVDWLPGGGVTITSYQTDGGVMGGDAAIDNDAAVPMCQLGVPPDTDCDGLDDDVDPYPGTPPFATQYDAIYHELAPGQTGSDSLDLGFNLNNADIYFLVDQSGSMDGERDRLIADLRTGTFLPGSYDCADTDFNGSPNNELKAQGIVGSIRCMIRDAWFGAGYFDEYPMGNHGHAYADADSDDEVVFRQLQPIAESINLVDNALSSMWTNSNIDWPESDVPALWSVATGSGMYLGHNRMGVPPQTACPPASHGYPCFRDKAIPIVVLFTDASFHNGPAPTSNAYSASYAIASGTQTSITPVPSTNEDFSSVYDMGDVTNSLVTFAGTTAGATADLPGSIMGCGASSLDRDVVFSFDVTQQRAITIKTDGTVDDTLVSLFGDIPDIAPDESIAVSGETYNAGDVSGRWIELTGTTSGNSGDVQGGVVGCSAGGVGKDTLFSFTPTQNVNLTARSAMADRVAWFRMGDGDTFPTAVDGTGEHAGTMTNMTSGDIVTDAPTAGTFANIKSIDFDGSNDSIVVANDAELDITDALTVSVWVKGASQSNTIVSKYETGRRSWRLLTSGTKARINISATGSPFDSSNAKDWTTSLNILDGTWHHVAFTYVAGAPDGTLKLYVDGVEDASITRTWNPNVPALYSTSAPVVIGAHYSSTDPFLGRIDEVAVWHAALSSGEVARVYNGGRPPDLNEVGGAMIALYSALPPARPTATASGNTNDSVSSAYNAAANLVGSYVAFSGDTAAVAITPSLADTTVGCGAHTDSDDVLYSFGLAQNRRVRIDTEGSSFDTVIALYDVAPVSVEDRTASNTNDTFSALEAIGPMVGKRYRYAGNSSALAPDFDSSVVGCGAASGANDAVYSFTLASPKTVRIDASTTTAFSPVISLHSAAPSEVTTVSTNSNEALSTTQSIGDVTGVRRVYTGGTTAGKAADYTAAIVGCAATDGAGDAVVDFTLSSPATVEIDSQGSSFDTVLGLFDDTAVADSLVSWWRMGDGATFSTIVDLISAHNGTMTNMAASDFEAVVPPQDYPNTRSTSFDATDDYVSIADAAALDFTTAMTFSAWVRGPSQSGTIASKHQTTGNQRSWRIYGNGSGGIAIEICRDGTCAAADRKVYVTTGVSPLNNAWHHVAFTFGGSALKVYVDGVQSAVTMTNDGTVATLHSGTAPVAIGATFSGSASSYFSGNIDEVSLWNSALTSIQLAALHNAGAPTNPAQLNEFPGSRPPAADIGSASTALQLDGVDESLSVTTDAGLDITNNLTVSLWANVTTDTRTLASKFRSNGNRRSWRMSSEGGKFRVVVSRTGDYSNTTAKVYETNAVVFGAGWVHVAFTFASGTLVLYVNGVAAAVTQVWNPAVATIYSTTSPKTIIGGYENSGGGAVTEQPNGVIDEVSIWTAALTAGQITAVYNAGVPTDLTGSANLLAWWRMGDGSTVPTINDAVGTRHMTMQNMEVSDVVPGVPGATLYTNEAKATAYDTGVINGRWKVFSGTTATMAVDGPTFGCTSVAATRDAYFTFTLTTSASVVIDTINSSFDTVIGLFPSAATAFSAAEALGCNDDAAGSPADSLTTGTLAAGTYYVVVKGGAASVAGAYELSIRDVAGPSLAANVLGTRLACSDDDGTENTSRITAALAAGTYHVVVKSTGASGAYRLRVSESGVGTNRLACSTTMITQALGAGTYYVIVKGDAATGEGAYTMSIEDTAVTGSALTCNDDGAVDGSSAIEADLLAGTTYYVAVKGKSAAAHGAYTLTLRDVADVPSNQIACGNDEVTSMLTAGQTYYVVVKGDSVAGDGPYSLVLQDTDNSGSQLIACDDDSGPGSQSLLTRTLDPGTYYLAMKKANHPQGQGNYQVSVGGAASAAGTYAPPTWAQTISALNADDIRVMTVYSTGGSDTAVLIDHATALANATDALGSDGQPLVSSMAGDGSGLSSALVDQIQELTQYLEMDVQLRVSYDPDVPPAPGFLFTFVAVDESPGNGCAGVVGIEHQDCLPGAVPRFQINITNPIGMPVPPNPSDPNGGYNFRLQLIGNDRYVVDEVPVYIVPVETLPPPPPLFAAEGIYWQDVDSRSCVGNQRPSWRELLFDTTLPQQTRVKFDICTGGTTAELNACTMRSVVTLTATGACSVTSDCAMGETCESNGVCRSITANACTVPTDCASTASCLSNVCTYTGSPVSLRQAIGLDGDFRSLLRLKVTLYANPARSEAPRLDQWQIRYECNDAQ